MLSGTVRAVLMSWVTIRKVASIWAFRSTISWLRNDVRTGSRPESGSSKSTISGSSPSALAHAARDLARELVLGAEQPDEVHLLHHDVADLGLGLPGVLAQRERDVVV